METVGQLVQVMPSFLLRCDLSTSTSPVYSMSMHEPYVFLSREHDDDVRDIGKHDFRSVLLHSMLSNANRQVTTNQISESIT